MAVKKLNLKSREAFAELSLHDKNAYLQEISAEIMTARGEEPVELDRDALSRLRRYYSRRSMADLRLEEVGGNLKGVLQRLADNIRTDEVRLVIQHELPPRKRPAGPFSRPAPSDDAQLMFFVPTVQDAPIKDDFNLMDIAPFSLSKSGGAGVIRYELKDSIITIEGGAEVGLATAYDYDIVINMISHLAEATRRFLEDERKGLRPSLPPQVYRPAAAEILKFCRRDLGGKQYIELERALARLQATNIRITNLKGEGKDRRATESFPLIGRYKVVSRTNQDRIDQVEIEVPLWVYEGVVRPDGKPTILTLNPDYFLISRPIARFIYRLARKAAGNTTACYSLRELRKRCDAKMPMRKFRRTIEEIVESAQTTPMPDYDLQLEDRGHDVMLHMSRRSKPAPVEMDLQTLPA